MTKTLAKIFIAFDGKTFKKLKDMNDYEFDVKMKRKEIFVYTNENNFGCAKYSVENEIDLLKVIKYEQYEGNKYIVESLVYPCDIYISNDYSMNEYLILNRESAKVYLNEIVCQLIDNDGIRPLFEEVVLQ